MASNKIPLGAADLLALSQLSACRFPRGSFAARFTRSLAAQVDGGQVLVTRRQRWALLTLCRLHRRRLRGPVLGGLLERLGDPPAAPGWRQATLF